VEDEESAAAVTSEEIGMIRIIGIQSSGADFILSVIIYCMDSVSRQSSSRRA